MHGDQSNVIYLRSSTSLLVGKEFSRENQFTVAMFFVMVIDSVWRETNVIKQPIFYRFFGEMMVLELYWWYGYAHAHKYLQICQKSNEYSALTWKIPQWSRELKRSCNLISHSDNSNPTILAKFSGPSPLRVHISSHWVLQKSWGVGPTGVPQNTLGMYLGSHLGPSLNPILPYQTLLIVGVKKIA